MLSATVKYEVLEACDADPTKLITCCETNPQVRDTAMDRNEMAEERTDRSRALRTRATAPRGARARFRSLCWASSIVVLAIAGSTAIAQTGSGRVSPPLIGPPDRSPPLDQQRNQANLYTPLAPEGSGGEADPIRADDQSLRKVMGTIPGERIDELTGELSLSMVDLSLRGTAGMDLTIGRTRRKWFTQDARVRHKFERHDMDTVADWRLDIPHIRVIRTRQSAFRIFNSDGTVNDSASTTFRGVCADFSPPTSFFGDTAQNLGAMQWRAPELVGFTGQPTRTLMYVARNVSLGDAVPASPLLTGAKYVTADHWKVTCDFSQHAPTKESKFIARSPDGMTYEFDEPSLGSQDATYPATADGFLRKYPTYLRVYVTRITDRNGNWIAFQYKNLRPSAERDLQDFAYVERITTNDNREVTFTWEPEPTCPATGCLTPSNLPKRFAPTHRLQSFSNNHRTWSFTYNSSPQADPDLIGVSLPDGSTWTYTILHQPAPPPPAPAPIPHVYTVRFPKGGEVRYFLVTRQRPLPNLQSTLYQSVQFKADFDALGNAYDTTYCTSQDSAAAAPKTLIVERKGCSVQGPNAGPCLLSTSHRSRLVTFQPQVLDSSGRVRWDEGLPISEVVYEGSLLTNGSASLCPTLAGTPVFTAPVLESKSYAWERLPLRFSHWRFTNNSPDDFYFPDAANYWRVPGLTTITRTSWGSFQTRSESYDELGFSQITRQSLNGQAATAASSRVFEQSYNHRLGLSGAPWIIGLPDTTRVLQAGLAISSVDNTYDSLGRLQSKVADATTTAQTYTVLGDIETLTDERGQVTNLSKHRLGIAQTVEFPAIKGSRDTETRVVSARGNVESITNARLKATAFAYDEIDRLRTVTYAVGSPMTITWSADGRTKTATRGRRTDTFRLDGFGRVISESASDTDYASETIARAYRYDGFGQLTFSSLPAATVAGATSGFEHQYDALGRLRRTLRTSDGAASLVNYSAGQVKTVTDFGNRSRVFTYRGFGAPIEEQLMSAVVPYTNRTPTGVAVQTSLSTSFVRDYLGFATSVTQGGVSRRFKLDARRLLEREFSPELGAADAAGFNVGYCRDDAGLELGKSIGEICPSPEKAQLMTGVYDARSRLVSLDYKDAATSDVSFELTPTNQVKKITRGLTILDLDYDEVEKPKSQIVSLDGYRFAFVFEYDTLNNIKAITYPSGRRQVIVSDALGRPRSVAGVVQSVAYTPSGIASSVVYANGQTTM